MKRLYTLSAAIAAAMVSTVAVAQVQALQFEPTQEPTSILEAKASKKSEAKGTELEVLWSEDFSNGFGGQGDNGAWTVAEEQGELWFLTYPAEVSGGYDPTLALTGASDLYGTNIPNYFGTRQVVASPTRDNGVLMMDADRWNSTSTEENPTPGALTQNPLLSALVSPPLDLTAAADGALITFYQYLRLCCSGYSASFDLSLDGGNTWIPYDVFTPYGSGNTDINQQISINISDVLASASDLTDCRMRFFWNGSQSHYFWMVDDIAVVSLPENDLIAGTTWVNNWYDAVTDFLNGDILAVEYLNTLDYRVTPDYVLRPHNFAMVVTNGGSALQTGVTLTVEVTTPGGSVVSFDSDPIELESGAGDTLTIPNIMPGTDFPIEIGQYSFAYSVSADVEDDRPDDNVGTTRVTSISDDASNNGFAIFRNDNANYAGAYTTLGQDVIWATNYIFTEPTTDQLAITHVEAVFLFAADFAETIAGEVVYFNVRRGSVLDEDPDNPDAPVTTVFFDPENPLLYEDSDIEFTIEESDIWISTDGLPYIWASFELPTPIPVETGIPYQAEYRVPAAGEGIVYPPVTNNQERFASLVYDFADAAWFNLGNNAMPLRFRTSSASSVEEITYESGIQLTQNYPNPFIDNTRIIFQMDQTVDVSLEVYDLAGKLVFTEDLGNRAAGVNHIYDFARGDLAAGLYTYSLVSAEGRVTRKMTIE
jgi:hypothetical protein